MPRRFPLLEGWFLAVLVGAALDVACTRWRFAYRAFAPDVLWQTPIAWVVVGAPPLLFAAALTGWLARRRGVRASAFALRWVGASAALGPVALHTWLSRHIGLEGDFARFAGREPWLELLGIGVGAAALVAAVRRYDARVPWRSSVLGALLGALLLAFASCFLGGGRAFRAAPADRDERPNVLLMVWDTCRADRLSAYRYDRETTPHLADFATQALVFEDARSVASYTFTSHASLLTGTYPSTHGARLVSSVLDPRRANSVALDFAEAGYRTGAFVGTEVLSGRTGLRAGFERYDDRVDPPVTSTSAWALINDAQVLLARASKRFRNNGQPHGLQNFQRPADEVLASALDWIDAEDERPWFAFVNLYDVHWPYLPDEAGERLVREYDGPLDGYLFRSDAYPAGYVPNAADRRHVSDLYDGEVLDLDRAVERFLSRLDLERGDTAVLLTSDHGEAFGEGGVWMHDDILEPQVRVPLLVRPAGVAPRGERVAGLVSGVDVAPTLLGLAGLPPRRQHEGLDLTTERPDVERTIRVEDRDHIDPDDVRVATYRGWWKLVERGRDRTDVRLFDLKNDALGVHDVRDRYPGIARALEALAGEQPRESFAQGGGQAQTTTDALRALGYVGR